MSGSRRTVLILISSMAMVLAAAQVEYTDHSRLLVFKDAKGRERPVRDLNDWNIRRQHIILGAEQVMGRLPDRTHLPPFEASILEELDGPNYTRRLIRFTAEPGDQIPAHLYVPKEIRSRRAAILALHPTSPLGKDVVAGLGPRPNRNYAVELAERGYVVLAPDYPSFGDYSDYDFSSDRYESGTMKGIFNHIRCLDFLETQKYVDPERIGVIGHSLGGHNAIFVAVFDERFKAIVSSCGWTPFHDYYGGNLKGWTSDRYMPLILEKFQLDPGRVPFDFYGLIAALAPRPFFSNSPIDDHNFDVSGVKKAIPEIRKVYRLFGAADNLQVRYPEAGHDFPPQIRAEAYRFLDQHLNHSPRLQ